MLFWTNPRSRTLYDHLHLILQITRVRRTSYVEQCWKSKGGIMWRSSMNSDSWTHQCWPTSKDILRSALCGHWIQCRGSVRNRTIGIVESKSESIWLANFWERKRERDGGRERERERERERTESFICIFFLSDKNMTWYFGFHIRIPERHVFFFRSELLSSI